MKNQLRFDDRRQPTAIALVLVAVVAFSWPAEAGNRNAEIRVQSNPPGALVSVFLSADTAEGGRVTVAGETPLTKTFRFPKKHNLWLRFEKAGFEPFVKEIGAQTSRISVDLMPLAGELIQPAPVMVLALVIPDLTVIRRGFAKEREDESAGVAAAGVIVRVISDRLAGVVEIVEVDEDGDFDILRPLWRDARSQMELVDPIRLPYLPVLPLLESRASRAAAVELAERIGADAVLFVAGKANYETGGMKAGKIGIMAAGTASSYASGYSSAMAGGSDFFTYNIYLPSFAEGLGLEALMIDTRSGAIRWANKGMWKPIPLDNPEVADAVVADLLSGIETQLATKNSHEEHEEEP